MLRTVAEWTMPAAKKTQRSAPLSRVTAKEREKQLKTEFDADVGRGALLSFLRTQR